MSLVVLGNIVMFVGSMMMVTVGFLKNKTQILVVQSVQCAVQVAGNLLLGGVTGALAGVFSIARNFICLKREFTTPFKVTFIVLQALSTVVFNNLGFIGWLPCFATAIFVWMLDTKDARVLKSAIIIGQIMWCIFDVRIRSYVGVAFDLFTITSNAVGIIMINRQKV